MRARAENETWERIFRPVEFGYPGLSDSGAIRKPRNQKTTIADPEQDVGAGRT
jgi:hypothetical protein